MQAGASGRDAAAITRAASDPLLAIIHMPSLIQATEAAESTEYRHSGSSECIVS